MAVRGGSSARAALGQLLGGGTPTTWLHEPYLPTGVTADDDGPPTPAPPPLGYLADATYAFDAATAALVDRSHADALGELAGADLDTYRACSVDLTMRGGTTSGVVYPLAVCEVARQLRVRNVGGASAGAIAASATAAAELGRGRLAAGAAQPPLAPDRAAEGHVHTGFAGLADIVAWLTELDGGTAGGPPTRERYRLARLFQPARATRRLWPVVTAVMRRRHWAAVPLAAVAFGWGWAVATLVVVLGELATTAVLLPVGDVGAGPRVTAAVGHLAALAALLTGVIGVVVQLAALRAARTAGTRLRERPAAQRRLLDVTSAVDTPVHRTALLTWAALSVGALAVEVLLALWLGSPGRSLLVAVPEALALVLLLGVLVGWVAARFVNRAEEVGHGLLSGATRAAGDPRPVVTWLDETLSELAGQPGRSLTFGDLWFGDHPCDDAVRARAAGDPRCRLVNLELITTDLTQQRAVRFPLPPTAGRREESGTTLHAAHADLVELLGPALADQLCPPANGVDARVQSRDGSWGALRLHPLPEPADLPVVLAVRMSMALPVLFTAVRLYRLRQVAGVRDDGGHTLRADGAPLRWPPADQLLGGPDGEAPVAEVVWFSDGGITSNFPVQLFDALLPEWPTFGLNLGPHPAGFEHQDVWLPEDWQSGLPPSVPVGASTLGLVGAIVDTARSWRDTAQTGMPSTRGRVAWVRQRSSEGGTNLYMARDTIASLALRGAYAGARLRQRFSTVSTGASGAPDRRPSWERHRWLRLRVAVQVLEEQRAHLAGSVPAYLPLLAPGAADAAAGGPFPEVPKPLYVPADPGFDHEAAALLTRSSVAHPVSAADADGPQPAPTLSLSPPL